MVPSSRGLGHRPFTAVTRVRISLGSPLIEKAPIKGAFSMSDYFKSDLNSRKRVRPQAKGGRENAGEQKRMSAVEQALRSNVEDNLVVTAQQ